MNHCPGQAAIYHSVRDCTPERITALDSWQEKRKVLQELKGQYCYLICLFSLKHWPNWNLKRKKNSLALENNNPKRNALTYSILIKEWYAEHRNILKTEKFTVYLQSTSPDKDNLKCRARKVDGSGGSSHYWMLKPIFLV